MNSKVPGKQEARGKSRARRSDVGKKKGLIQDSETKEGKREIERGIGMAGENFQTKGLEWSSSETV